MGRTDACNGKGAMMNCTWKLDAEPTFGCFFMAKYSEQLKLKMVKMYLAGVSGAGYLRSVTAWVTR
jgi:hypothetical protein